MSDKPTMSERIRQAARQRSWPEQIGRLVRYRMLVPLKRSLHPPEHTARGVLIGLIFALNPLIGIQMGLCFIFWLIARWVFRWDFNVIVAMGWTWISNVITAFPIYYVFYVTGQVLLGRWDDLAGYHRFVGVWSAALDRASAGHINQWLGTDWSVIDLTEAYIAVFVRDLGTALAVGCVPYMIVFGWLGYRWSLRFVVAYRRARTARMRKRASARRPEAGKQS